MMKYYFIVYQCSIKGSHASIYQDIIEDVHPIRWQIENNKKYGKTEEYLILNWKELTKEEYDEFKGYVG